MTLKKIVSLRLQKWSQKISKMHSLWMFLIGGVNVFISKSIKYNYLLSKPMDQKNKDDCRKKVLNVPFGERNRRRSETDV